MAHDIDDDLSGLSVLAKAYQIVAGTVDNKSATVSAQPTPAICTRGCRFLVKVTYHNGLSRHVCRCGVPLEAIGPGDIALPKLPMDCTRWSPWLEAELSRLYARREARQQSELVAAKSDAIPWIDPERDEELAITDPGKDVADAPALPVLPVSFADVE